MKRRGRERRAALPPSGRDAERAARLHEVLDRLFEANLYDPIVVEGRRDALALRSMGFIGEIVRLHRGSSLDEFCEGLAGEHPGVVLLLDWDPEGDALMAKVAPGLRGHYEEHARFREALRALCRKEVKDVEGIPALLWRLEGPEAAGQPG
jgi:5S rRNA maturation endonuclease (ribonuclease M5)